MPASRLPVRRSARIKSTTAKTARQILTSEAVDSAILNNSTMITTSGVPTIAAPASASTSAAIATTAGIGVPTGASGATTVASMANAGHSIEVASLMSSGCQYNMLDDVSLAMPSIYPYRQPGAASFVGPLTHTTYAGASRAMTSSSEPVMASTAAQSTQDSIFYEMQKQISALERQLENAQTRISQGELEHQRLKMASQNSALATVSFSQPVSTIAYSNMRKGVTNTTATSFQMPASVNFGTKRDDEQTSNPVQPNYASSSLSHNGMFTQMPNTAYENIRPYNAIAIPRKILDLPEFSGQPEEWPIFYAAYTESTSAYQYTSFENNQRLNKCLKGVAKETVKSLLIHPSNVEAIIEQLRFRFGRPELLVRSQLKIVRDAPYISEAAIAKIVPFATLTRNLTAFLQSIGEERHLENPMLLEELVAKLPISKRLEWVKYAARIQPYPTIAHFSDWLSEIASYVQMIHETEYREPKRHAVLHATGDQHVVKCPVCLGAHKTSECKRLADATVPERWQRVKRLRLCFGCLNAGHTTRDCRSRRVCSMDGCTKYHNRILHEAASFRPKPAIAPGPKANAGLDAVPPTIQERPKAYNAVLSCTAPAEEKLLFRVVPVTLYGPIKSVHTYALLDEGSSITMMDDVLVAELGLQGQQRQMEIQWFGGKAAREPVTVANLYISGRNMKKRHMIRNVHGVSNLNLPVQSLHASDIPGVINQRGKVSLQPYANVVPTILIGLDHCHLGLPTEPVMIYRQGPYAAYTELGWVVFGPTKRPPARKPTCLHVCPKPEQQLHNMVAEYFTVESFGVRAAPLVESAADIRAKKILEDTIIKIDGRFQAGLLWRSDDIELPESYNMAMQRLVGIERKMSRNQEFSKAYCNIVDAYVSKGYARKLLPLEANSSGPRTWYLPHFGVVNPHKPGKLRLVFDAAAKSNGVSLNSQLLKGPQEYRSLMSILFHFREGAVGVCADIKEMFHQVRIQPKDRCAQRFLWRNGDNEKPPDVYEMTAMTFGAACSPCTAHYVKTKNALEHSSHHPRAVKAIIDYHYVDDFVDSFDSVSRAIEISQQVREIHSDAGFELCKFTSNCPEVVAPLGGDSTALPIKSKECLESEKVLGMLWQPLSDEFTYRLKFYGVDISVVDGERPPTKRELLSIVMSIFDPLGFLCNFTISAKLVLRELWKKDVRWDEPVPNEVNAMWHHFRNQLQNVLQCQIPRHYFRAGIPQSLQLHIFVDASEEAFAAVAYWRATNANNAVEVSLVFAKTRTAPIKPLTIPRLELQAAVLGTRMMCTILEEHTIRVDRYVLWSDSKTVLKWIASEHRRYKPFVAHRIAEILNASKPSDWRWLPTKENVADEATRASKDINLSSTSRWFTGPNFLRQDESMWPNESPAASQHKGDDEELRPKYALVAVSKTFIDYRRFSSFVKLKRMIAWVIRFVNNCLKRINDMEEHGLTAAELETAERFLCRQAQQEAFVREMHQIKNGNVLPRDNALYTLMPYIDVEGILRVNGRLDAASWLPQDTKRPIILPSGHPFTKLIVDYEHRRMVHQNTEATICKIRSKYWIPNLRKVLRGVIANCNTCKLMKTKPFVPIMGLLPEDRLTPHVRPFTFTGLDYFGPVNVTIGRRTEKRWVALFTCLTIRAIHLEVAYDLSTDACVLAMRNFMNRRGVPKRIRSDNGKNFIGVEGEMKRLGDVFDCYALQNELSSKGVEWVFNCPANPSEGGVWERMVQCVKRVLRHTMKEVAPKEHTLQSLLIEAENVVNSRPLTHIPVSPDQEEPLTPNHFLLGSANTAQTPSIAEQPVKLCAIRKQWRIARQLRDRFWKRWVAEYLPTLTRRAKWCAPTKPLQVGDLVFICDVNEPRKNWRRGRVERVFHGNDGEVRRADVRTSTGLTQRPASKLAILDVDSGES